MLKEKILIVTPYFPYPITSGGAQAQYHMIDNLRKECQIVLAYISPRRNDDKKLQEIWPEVTFCPYEGARMKWLTRKKEQLAKWFDLIPDKNSKAYLNPALMHSFEGSIDYRFVDFLQEIIVKEQIHIMQFEFVEYLNMVFAFPQVRRIFVHHEIHFIRNQRFLKDLNILPARDLYQYNLLKQQEIMALNACDEVIALTETDKLILEQENVTPPIFVSPAIIPSPYDELPEAYKFNGTLVFLGGMQHAPNYEGIMWFLDNVWEDVLKEFPSLRLQIIGKWRNRVMKHIESHYRNVDMMGYVADIEPCLINSVMVVPILTGSGMRMKIIDAANMGVPFITTSVGVEGLDFENDIDCFVADGENGFRQKVIELVTNEQMQRSFRDNAFRKMKNSYSTEALLEKRLACYQALS